MFPINTLLSDSHDRKSAEPRESCKYISRFEYRGQQLSSILSSSPGQAHHHSIRGTLIPLLFPRVKMKRGSGMKLSLDSVGKKRIDLNDLENRILPLGIFQLEKDIRY